MREKTFEFSKVIVRRGMFIFAAQVLITLAIIFFQKEAAFQVVSLMNATIPLYAVIFGGYFGKAGLENYEKIKNDGRVAVAATVGTENPIPKPEDEAPLG